MGRGLGRNLTHGMLDSIGRSIVIGDYDNRLFPTEAALAKQYAVSSSVTREAVKMLSAKGLLSARPRQGTIIQPSASWNLFDADVLRWLLERKFSIELLRQLNELRAAIEPEAAALAAFRADAEDIKLMNDGFECMEAADKGLGNALDAHIAFHVAVLRASRNRFYGQLQDVVATASRMSIFLTNRITDYSTDIDGHAEVRDAIATRHQDRARAAMSTIIGNVLRLTESVELEMPRNSQPLMPMLGRCRPETKR